MCVVSWLVLTVSVNDGKVLEVTPNCGVHSVITTSLSPTLLTSLTIQICGTDNNNTRILNILLDIYFSTSSSNGHFSTMYSSISLTLAENTNIQSTVYSSIILNIFIDCVLLSKSIHHANCCFLLVEI